GTPPPRRKSKPSSPTPGKRPSREKFQAPTTKLQRNTKSKPPNINRTRLEVWSLKFLWMLELARLHFVLARSRRSQKRRQRIWSFHFSNSSSLCMALSAVKEQIYQRLHDGSP